MSLPEKIKSVTSSIESMAQKGEVQISTTRGDVQLLVPQAIIHDVLRKLKEEFGFTYLADMVAADRFTSDDRFEVIWNLVSLKDRMRVFVKTRCSEEKPVLPTTTDIWQAANWNEREAYDMFGIQFEGHPDMRRLFLPEDFQFFPLRKEFPMMGVPGSLELPTTSPDFA